MSQKERAAAFLRLHTGPHALVLPNIWDVVSARVVEAAGFAALATSSAAVAWSLGRADGERLSRVEMAEVVARIVQGVGVPVTADMEAGYGLRPEDAAQTAGAVVAAGAVGMNLEDAAPGAKELIDQSLQVERVRAATEAATAAGVPIVINARTDVFLKQIGDPESRVDHAVRRLNAYREAGAASLFAPGVKDAATIGVLAREVGGPLNILGGPGVPSIPELVRLGVRRISLGGYVMRASLGAVRQVALELGGPGTYTALTSLAWMDDINRLVDSSRG